MCNSEPYLGGSRLRVYVCVQVFYRNRAEGLEHLNLELCRYYEANRDANLSKVTPLAMSQVIASDPGYPYLKAKAAATRHLIEFGKILAYRHKFGGGGMRPFRFPPGHRMAGQVQLHLDLQVELFEGLSQYSQSCSATPFSPDACKDGMYRFLIAHSKLHVLWRRHLPMQRRDAQPWHIRPKAHALQHLVEDKLVLWGSPSRSWCYRDEDWCGAIKVIAANTKDPRSLERRVVQKLILLSGLHMSL